MSPLLKPLMRLRVVVKAFSESARLAALEARRAKAKGGKPESKAPSGSSSSSQSATGGAKVEERTKISQNGSYKLTEADKTEAKSQLDDVASAEGMKVFETKVMNYGTEMTTFANHPELGRVEMRADTGHAAAYRDSKGKIGENESYADFQTRLGASTKNGPVQYSVEITGGKENNEYMQGNIIKLKGHGASAEEAFANVASRARRLKETGKFHPHTWYAGRGSNPSGFDAGFSG